MTYKEWVCWMLAENVFKAYKGKDPLTPIVKPPKEKK
jgi:hypothetical protein